MKHIAIHAITIYQLFLAFPLKTITGTQSVCRFSPTCSAYAKEAIQIHGAWKGLCLGMQRLFSCQPFSKNPRMQNA
ncbi:MAG: membrane protein insertion efficiency factor YidD [Candidatus Levybacteria bacterium]|nr:membrane protein insertion efficiency factor YidD [Candidatus Levybacteria bacterium]